MSVRLSVVICTFNRHAWLEDAIASIEVQDCPPEQFELIIVDNSSDRAAQAEFIQRADIACRHQIIIEETPGLSRARNAGVYNARGEIVAFMDDDARAAGNWISQLLADFDQNPGAGIVGGPVRPIWPGTRPPWLHPWLEGFLTIVDRGLEPRLLSEAEWLAGTNIAFRRGPLIEAGLFNENLGRVGKLLLSNEELAVTARLRASGFSVLYDPKVEMHHRVHAERINQAWMRRRVFWQVISDVFANGAEPDAFDGQVARILDYQMKLKPRDRGLSGLFLDLDDPVLFHEQTAALAAFVRLLATDGQDWRAFLAAAAA